MKRRALIFIIILRCVTCSDAFECYVCEAEKDEMICRDPTAKSVKAEAVLCSANGDHTVCSTTLYKRKCIDGGEVLKYLLLCTIIVRGSMQISMRKLNSHTILQNYPLWCCCHVIYKLLYPSIRVRTALLYRLGSGLGLVLLLVLRCNTIAHTVLHVSHRSFLAFSHYFI